MKKITLTLIALFLFSMTFAQVDLFYTPGPATDDPVQISFAFVEATDDGSPIINIGDDENAAFGYNANFTQLYVEGQNEVTLFPNNQIWTANNGSLVTFNTFWFSAQGVPRKSLNVLTFNEIVWDGNGDAPDLLNEELTFRVDLTEYTLDPAYTVRITITVFEENFQNFRRELLEIPSDGSGEYSVTLSNVSANDRIWQWGFSLEGPMASPNDNTLGDVRFDQPSLSTEDVQISGLTAGPNPTKNKWIIKGFEQIDTIQVFDVFGKEVISLQPNALEVELDATYLNSGLYLAKIANSTGTKTIKLVKN